MEVRVMLNKLGTQGGGSIILLVWEGVYSNCIKKMSVSVKQRHEIFYTRPNNIVKYYCTILFLFTWPTPHLAHKESSLTPSRLFFIILFGYIGDNFDGVVIL